MRNYIITDFEKKQLIAYLHEDGPYTITIRKLVYAWEKYHKAILQDIVLLERLEAKRAGSSILVDLPSIKFLAKKREEELELLKALEAKRR
jgi:hypothetical protein